MNLYELSKAILAVSQQPIDRVRFTKTIYFIHKELIRKGQMKPEDIPYLRLPLGPVPANFLNLTREHPDIKLRPIPTHILYVAEEYYIEPNTESISEDVVPIIQRLLQLLKTHSTTELVIASQDPSWQNHQNGEEYVISPADLRNTSPLPHIRLKIHIKRRQPSHLGALQAHLLRGMLEDIVKESTDLEYPDETPPHDQEAKK